VKNYIQTINFVPSPIIVVHSDNTSVDEDASNHSDSYESKAKATHINYVTNELKEGMNRPYSNDNCGTLVIYAYGNPDVMNSVWQGLDTIGGHNRKEYDLLEEEARNYLVDWFETSDIDFLVELFEVIEMPLPDVLTRRLLLNNVNELERIEAKIDDGKK
jgi:hypothetical protein